MNGASCPKQRFLKRLCEQSVQKVKACRIGSGLWDLPFRHILVDGFLPPSLARSCANNFPTFKNKSWQRTSEPGIEIKLRSDWKSEFDIPEHIIDVTRILNSGPMLRALGEVFCIPKLVADPYFTGGGLNALAHGGLLDVHVDGNYHDATGLNRRLNVILYLNERYKAERGGALGLYNRNGSECLKKIDPLFNRLFAFETHDYSFHGLPEPIKFPRGQMRKSVILYYYTKSERPASQTRIVAAHSALWRSRGGRDRNGKLTRKTIG